MGWAVFKPIIWRLLQVRRGLVQASPTIVAYLPEFGNSLAPGTRPLLAQLTRVALLVLDDFLLTPASVEQARDLLEVVEDRTQVRSTMVASQLPVESWHGAIADPTLADAILDRLLQSAHRLNLKGPSLRRREPEPNPGG